MWNTDLDHVLQFADGGWTLEEKMWNSKHCLAVTLKTGSLSKEFPKCSAVPSSISLLDSKVHFPVPWHLIPRSWKVHVISAFQHLSLCCIRQKVCLAFPVTSYGLGWAVLSRSVVSDSLRPVDCSPPGSSVHEDSPGKNTRVGCHALLQGIFPTQGLNPGLPHCRWMLYCLSHQGHPKTWANFLANPMFC